MPPAKRKPTAKAGAGKGTSTFLKPLAPLDAPLTVAERRTLAHLGIPRNVPNLSHEMRVDEHAPTRPDGAVYEHLTELAGRGLVVNLGEHYDPVKAAVKAEKDAQSITLHDESAEIYSRRLKAPHHSWRMDGDLWILSHDGLDALKAPGVDEPPPMTVSQVQEVIDAEWERTIRGANDAHYFPGPKGAAPALANSLLEDEFLAWAKAVADDCEARWGERPRLPLAGGSAYSDAWEIAILDAENQKTALGAVVDPWYMALVIVALTDADTGTTTGDGTRIPTYTGYARKSVAGSDMNAASGTGGSVTNANAIIFAACTAGSSVIVGYGNTSASTAGTLRKYGTCSATISTTQTPGQFAAAGYTTSIA